MPLTVTVTIAQQPAVLNAATPVLRQLLHLQPNDAINKLNERQLSDLLYRDTLVLKHSASNHINKAVQMCNKASVAQAKQAESEKRTIRSNPTSSMASAVVDFLVQAGAGGLCFFTVFHIPVQ